MPDATPQSPVQPMAAYVLSLTGEQKAAWADAVSQATGLGFNAALEAIDQAARIFDLNPNSLLKHSPKDTAELMAPFHSLMSAILSPGKSTDDSKPSSKA